jgi:hypothetical protein
MSQEDDHEKFIRDRICDNINSAITVYEEALRVAQGLGSGTRQSELPIIYTEATRHLFHRAWSFAALLRHREVIVDHVLTALISSAEATLPDRLASDPIVPLTGALVRIAILEPIAGDQTMESLRPTENLVKWVREANKLTTIRDGDKRLDTSDLISVFSSTEVDPNVRGMMQRIQRRIQSAGHPPAQLERVRQDIDSFKRTTGHHRHESNESFSEVKSAIAASNAHVARLDDLHAAVDSCQNQLAEVGRRTSEIGDTQLAGLAEAVGDCRSQLANLDHRTAEIRDTQLARLAANVEACQTQLVAIEAGLPRPLGSGWLALATAGVIVLGIVVGTALSDGSLLGSLIGELASRAREFLVN